MRSGEVRGAAWTEIDRDQGVWTIPASRTKANREHRVPLCRRALEILDEARALARGNPLVFPSVGGKPIGSTAMSELLRALKIGAVPHGFRSSFRDWAAEETDHPREVAEAALAHTVRNQIEAIRSGTAFRSPYFSSAWMCPGQRWPTLKCRCRQLIDLWEFPRPGWWSPRWPVWVAFVLRVLDPNRAIQTGSDLGHQ